MCACAQDAVQQGWFLRGGVAGADPNVAAIKTAALQTATGMAYLHGRDLIHGNLNAGAQSLTSFFLAYVWSYF